MISTQFSLNYEYLPADFARMFNQMIPTGVVFDLSLSAGGDSGFKVVPEVNISSSSGHPPGTRAVTVQPGSVWISGKLCTLTTSQTVQIPADNSLDKSSQIWAIVLRMNPTDMAETSTERATTIERVSGPVGAANATFAASVTKANTEIHRRKEELACQPPFDRIKNMFVPSRDYRDYVYPYPLELERVARQPVLKNDNACLLFPLAMVRVTAATANVPITASDIFDARTFSNENLLSFRLANTTTGHKKTDSKIVVHRAFLKSCVVAPGHIETGGAGTLRITINPLTFWPNWDGLATPIEHTISLDAPDNGREFPIGLIVPANSLITLEHAAAGSQPPATGSAPITVFVRYYHIN